MIQIDGKRYVTVSEACRRLKIDPYPIAAALVQGVNAGDRARDLDLGRGLPRLRVERHLGSSVRPGVERPGRRPEPQDHAEAALAAHCHVRAARQVAIESPGSRSDGDEDARHAVATESIKPRASQTAGLNPPRPFKPAARSAFRQSPRRLE
jgi:hypothetical protein